MASTLPPERVVSTTVPVVSFPGESESAAKNDPTGPQALMRKTREMEVQGQVDSKFDTNVSPHEGFQVLRKSPNQIFAVLILLVFAVLGLGLATRSKQKSSGLLIGAFVLALLFLQGFI